MSFTDDIPKHKKRSKKKVPKKANHKHLCEICIVEYPRDWHLKEHARSSETISEFYGYCPICGKITAFCPEHDRWYTQEKCYNGTFYYLQTIPTEEGRKELNPKTRTLPTFKSDSYFVKNIKLEG